MLYGTLTYEAAFKNGAHRCRVGRKGRQWSLKQRLNPRLTDERETKRHVKEKRLCSELSEIFLFFQT